MRYFAKESVNKGRQPELDWLKAVCILMMIMLHVYDDCGSEPGGPLYGFFDYACTFLGAAAFMICMGVGMRYSRKQNAKSYVLRGFEILTVGQFLNLLRNALPNLIAWWATGKNIFIAHSLLVLQADILTFAGLAFLLIAFLKQLKASDGCILAVGMAMNVLALPIHHYLKLPENYLAGQFLGFFVLTDQAAFFPLMSYFVFVAFGYYIGSLYPRIADKRALSNRVLLVCVPVVVIYYALRINVPFPLLPEFNSQEQYIMNPATDAVATCMVSLIALAAFSRLSERMGGQSAGLRQTHFSAHQSVLLCQQRLYLPDAHAAAGGNRQKNAGHVVADAVRSVCDRSMLLAHPDKRRTHPLYDRGIDAAQTDDRVRGHLDRGDFRGCLRLSKSH